MRYKWTDDALAELDEYHRMGLPYKEIAEIMEAPHESVRQIAAKRIRAGILESRYARHVADIKKQAGELAELESEYAKRNDKPRTGDGPSEATGEPEEAS